MRKDRVAFWLVAGIPLALVDAWLSIQSMAGVFNPANPIGTAAAVVTGVAMTLIAVVLPMHLARNNSLLLRLFWVFVGVADLASSILGMLWYGVMRKPLKEQIDFHKMHFKPEKSGLTAVSIGFVLLLLFGCIQLGRALDHGRTKQ
jgi:hypothetical protein